MTPLKSTDRFLNELAEDRLMNESAKTCACCKLWKKRMREMEIENYRKRKLIEWILYGEKPAVLSFTAGPERQIAYAVEQLMGWKRPGRWYDKRPTPRRRARAGTIKNEPF